MASTKTIIKGLIEEVGTIETAKESGRKYQRVLVKVPGRTNDFGEKVSDDSIYEVMIYGDTIQKFWSKHDDKNPTKKVEVSCYLNSRENKTDKGTFYNLSLTAIEAKFLQ